MPEPTGFLDDPPQLPSHFNCAWDETDPGLPKP
jgi:hypothetical protein